MRGDGGEGGNGAEAGNGVETGNGVESGNGAEAGAGGPTTVELLDRPAVLLAGGASALATAAALVAFLGTSLLFDARNATFGPLTVVVTLLVYDAVLVLTKPAVLPGLYAVVREQGSAAGLGAGLGRLATAARAHYADVTVALFVSRVATYGYAVLLGVVAVVVLLVGATAVSLGLYASGLADSIDPRWVEPTLLGGILAVRLAGQVPVSYADLLAVDGTRPRRAWLASRRLLGREPGAVRRGAVWRTILGATPVLAVVLAMSVLATTPGTLVSVAAPAAVLVVVGTFTKSLEGIVLVRRLETVEGPDALARPAVDWRSRLDPRSIAPSRRTLLALVLVAGLVVGSASVRLADTRPDPGPEQAAPLADPANASASTLYDAARNRTLSVPRTVTETVARANWTTGEPRWTRRVTMARTYAAREMSVTGWNRTDGSRDRLGWAYARDGLSYLKLPGADLATRYRGASHPDRQAVSHYRILTDEPPRYYPPNADGAWEMATDRDGTATLRLDDPPDVKTAEGWVDSPEVRYRNESTVSVTVDLETQRLERASVTERYVIYHSADHERVDVRVHREQSLEYRYGDVDVTDGDVDVTGPEYLGRGAHALLWDLVYY